MMYYNRSYITQFVIFFAVCMAVGLTQINVSEASKIEIVTEIDSADVNEIVKTPYDLYLSAREAYTAIIKNPSIVLIDVRDPAEITFVGHPEPMDTNIPTAVISRSFNPKNGLYNMTPNENFVAEVGQFMTRSNLPKSHPIIVACREGIRAAAAAKLLYNAGYKNVWNQIEGFEGSLDLENGKRSDKDGWVNADLPFRYKIKPGAEWQPLSN